MSVPLHIALTIKVIFQDVWEETWAGFRMACRDLLLLVAVLLWPVEGILKLCVKDDDVAGTEAWILGFCLAGFAVAQGTSVAFHYSYHWWAAGGVILYFILCFVYEMIIHPDMLEEPSDDWP